MIINQIITTLASSDDKLFLSSNFINLPEMNTTTISSTYKEPLYKFPLLTSKSIHQLNEKSLKRLIYDYDLLFNILKVHILFARYADDKRFTKDDFPMFCVIYLDLCKEILIPKIKNDIESKWLDLRNFLVDNPTYLVYDMKFVQSEYSSTEKDKCYNKLLEQYKITTSKEYKYRQIKKYRFIDFRLKQENHPHQRKTSNNTYAMMLINKYYMKYYHICWLQELPFPNIFEMVDGIFDALRDENDIYNTRDKFIDLMEFWNVTYRYDYIPMIHIGEDEYDDDDYLNINIDSYKFMDLGVLFVDWSIDDSLHEVCSANPFDINIDDEYVDESNDDCFDEYCSFHEYSDDELINNENIDNNSIDESINNNSINNNSFDENIDEYSDDELISSENIDENINNSINNNSFDEEYKNELIFNQTLMKACKYDRCTYDSMKNIINVIKSVDHLRISNRRLKQIKLIIKYPIGIIKHTLQVFEYLIDLYNLESIIEKNNDSIVPSFDPTDKNPETAYNIFKSIAGIFDLDFTTYQSQRNENILPTYLDRFSEMTFKQESSYDGHLIYDPDSGTYARYRVRYPCWPDKNEFINIITNFVNNHPENYAPIDEYYFDQDVIDIESKIMLNSIWDCYRLILSTKMYQHRMFTDYIDAIWGLNILYNSSTYIYLFDIYDVGEFCKSIIPLRYFIKEIETNESFTKFLTTKCFYEYFEPFYYYGDIYNWILKIETETFGIDDNTLDAASYEANKEIKKTRELYILATQLGQEWCDNIKNDKNKMLYHAYTYWWGSYRGHDKNVEIICMFCHDEFNKFSSLNDINSCDIDRYTNENVLVPGYEKLFEFISSLDEEIYNSIKVVGPEEIYVRNSTRLLNKL